MGRSRAPSSRSFRPLRLVGWALGFALLFGWLSIYAIPDAIEAGLAERAAQRIPYFAFLVGAQVGLVAAVVDGVSAFFARLGLIAVAGAVFGFFGVLLGGVVVGLGATEETADQVATGALVLGLLVGGAPLLVEVVEHLRSSPR